MVRTAALALALFAAALPAQAKPASFRAQVDQAKAELVEDADLALSDALRSDPATFERTGLSYTEGRNLALWLMMSVPLGSCHRNGGEAAYSLWLSASDTFSARSPGAVTAAQRGYDRAKTEDELSSLTPARRASVCKVRVTAVRELLAERFGVR